MSLTRRWHVVLTHSNAEWHVHTGLLKAGKFSYFPYVLDDRRNGRWTQGSVRPQFPGYIFAATEAGQSVEPLLAAAGVRDLLRSGVNIVVLPQAQLDRIRDQCSVRYRESVPRRIDQRRWRAGDIVPVPYGSLAGTPVEIRSIDRRGRVVASIGGLTVTFLIEVDAPLAVPTSMAQAFASRDGVVQHAVPSMAARRQNSR